MFEGDPWNDAVALHRRLAYVPGDVGPWLNLAGGEAIDLLGRLRGGLNQARQVELIERFDLDPTKQGRTYSKGNRQKVAIVAALAADSELLVFASPRAMAESMQRRIAGWLTVRQHDCGAHLADIAVGRVPGFATTLGVESDSSARGAISSREERHA